jgi:ATP-GRASP peptide maturase of grasp-with-spasm system
MKKKILILSEEDDGTTETVIKWIKYYGCEFLRINPSNILSFEFLSLLNDEDDVEFIYENQNYKLSSFTAYWYRRGGMNFNYKMVNLVNKNINQSVETMLYREYNYINNYIYSYFEKKNILSIGSIFDNKTNKVVNLLKARSLGLLIPNTIIATRKSQLMNFKINHQKILVKPIYQAGFIFENDEIKTDGLSVLMSDDEICNLPDSFAPSLFQGYIEKKYELRVFYLNGECYTSVIFSQLDEQTKVDFRNYNFSKPNRTPPYKLPAEISNKIKKLMDELNMNSGSLDIIVTPQNEFVFLEVNPVGQFFQVSYPCNYYLEKKIAKYLCNA